MRTCLTSVVSLSVLHLVAGSPACLCSSGIIPVDVDVIISTNASDPPNATLHTRHLKTTYDVYGQLCQPVSSVQDKSTGLVQLLLHGLTYTSQYWDTTWNGFQNYSYVDYACNEGLTTFAYDNVCSGQSEKVNSTDCQVAMASNVSSTLAHDLKSGRVSEILTGSSHSFDKVVGIGHSLGSLTLNYAVIGGGASSPFDGVILTGHLHDPGFLAGLPVTTLPAASVEPARWGALDDGYITTPNASSRLVFYEPNLDTFSHHVFHLDELTKDIGPTWIAAQGISIYAPATGYTGLVELMVGGSDEIHCLSSGAPCNQTALQMTEPAYFPDAKSVAVRVLPGYGHDIGLEYSAAETFRLYTDFASRV